MGCVGRPGRPPCTGRVTMVLRWRPQRPRYGERLCRRAARLLDAQVIGAWVAYRRASRAREDAHWLQWNASHEAQVMALKASRHAAGVCVSCGHEPVERGTAGPVPRAGGRLLSLWARVRGRPVPLSLWEAAGPRGCRWGDGRPKNGPGCGPKTWTPLWWWGRRRQVHALLRSSSRLVAQEAVGVRLEQPVRGEAATCACCGHYDHNDPVDVDGRRKECRRMMEEVWHIAWSAPGSAPNRPPPSGQGRRGIYSGLLSLAAGGGAAVRRTTVDAAFHDQTWVAPTEVVGDWSSFEAQARRLPVSPVNWAAECRTRHNAEEVWLRTSAPRVAWMSGGHIRVKQPQKKGPPRGGWGASQHTVDALRKAQKDGEAIGECLLQRCAIADGRARGLDLQRKHLPAWVREGSDYRENCEGCCRKANVWLEGWAYRQALVEELYV